MEDVSFNLQTSTVPNILNFLDFCDQLHKIIGRQHKNCKLRMYSETIRDFFKKEDKTDDEKKIFVVAYYKISKQVFGRMYLKFLSLNFGFIIY